MPNKIRNVVSFTIKNQASKARGAKSEKQWSEHIGPKSPCSLKSPHIQYSLAHKWRRWDSSIIHDDILFKSSKCSYNIPPSWSCRWPTRLSSWSPIWSLVSPYNLGEIGFVVSSCGARVHGRKLHLALAVEMKWSSESLIISYWCNYEKRYANCFFFSSS